MESGLSEVWVTYTTKFSELKGLGTQFRHITKPIISCFSSDSDLKMVEKFFKENPYPEAKKEIAQGLEQIRNRARWMGMDAQTFLHLFENDENF